MTYLQLINNVLTRLREDSISAEQVDSDPFLRSIGAHVNDAKNRVEDAWQWSHLRGTDTVPLEPYVGAAFALPGSADNHYIIKRFLISDKDGNGAYREVRQTSVPHMRQLYANNPEVPQAECQYVAVTGRTGTGDVEVTVFPKPLDDGFGGAQETLLVDRVKHDADLTDASQELNLPSLPVYTLATALASRERGELGGTPTSELFAIADRHLSDAIAQDSALYADEMDWYTSNRWHETNLRFS